MVTREALAELIRWSWIIGIVAVLNSCFMLPQLAKIWMTRDTDGISVITFLLIFLIQFIFFLHGFFIRDDAIMLSNAAATLTSISVVFSTFYIRRQKHCYGGS